MNDLHLERRGQLAPLAETTERDLQTDPFSTLYVSPCQIQVSNDPFDEPLDVLDLIPCNLKQYGCPGRQDGPTIDIPVEYDFEIHYDTSADFDTTMKALEGASLQHAANLAGLLDCNPTETAVERQNGNNLRRLNRYLQSLLTDEEKAALIGISSDPEDTADPDISEWMADYYGRVLSFLCCAMRNSHYLPSPPAECIVPVQSGVLEGTACTPIKGRITATIDGDASGPTTAGIVSGLLRTVRQGMIDDVYVTGNIKKVSFIGERAESNNAFGGPDSVRDVNVTSENDPGLSSIGIAFVAVGAALLVALIALLVARRQRRRSEERNMIFHDATVQAKELEAEEEDRLAAAVAVGGLVAAQGNDPNAVEGADVVGSLANRDELALQPNPAASSSGMTTGDLDDSVGVSHGGGAPPVRQSPSDFSDYISDTQSLDDSVGSGNDVSMYSSDYSSAQSSFDTDTTGGTSTPNNTGMRAGMMDHLNVIREVDSSDSDTGLQQIV